MQPFLSSAEIVLFAATLVWLLAARPKRRTVILIRRALFTVLLVALIATKKPASIAGAEGGYMAPRYPQYVVKPPTSVNDLMANARALVRNRVGFQGLGLGAIDSGTNILIVTNSRADDLVFEAVKRALEERSVKVQIVADYKLVGVSRQEAEEVTKRQAVGAKDGFMEASIFWINGAWRDPDRQAAKDYLKSARPDLFAKLYPAAMELTPAQEAIRRKLMITDVGPAIAKYIKEHPEVQKIFWGEGGGSLLRRYVHPYEDKYAGVFTIDTRAELMSKMPYYPGDVWLATEQRSMDAIAYIDKVHVSDPEGTDISWDMTDGQSQAWAQGVYQRGHLYMHPSQASGRFAYSVVDYPAVTQWVPRIPMALTNGVIAGTNGHGGYFPQMKTYYKNGYIVKVEGGGVNGELLQTFMKYPGINTLTYPFHEGYPGYWYHYEVALGTNPKAFRDPGPFYGNEPGLGLGPERTRAGVFHFGQGLELRAEPETQGPPLKWFAFVDQHKLPYGHGFHYHNYFVTYEAHLRNTDRWIKIVDKGRMTSLDDPETRALASRYGNPDEILAYEWVPQIPGINAPGNYAEYSKDPYPYQKAVMDRVMNGTYEHFVSGGKPATKK